MEENATLVDPVRRLVVDKDYSKLPRTKKKKTQRKIARHILAFFLGPPARDFDQYCTEPLPLSVGKDESPFSRHKVHLAIDKLALAPVLKLGLHLLLSVQTQNTQKLSTLMNSVHSVLSIVKEMEKRRTDYEDKEESPQFFVLDCILAKLVLECIHPVRRRIAKIKDCPAAVFQTSGEVLSKMLLPPLTAASLEWLGDFEVEEYLPWGETVCVDYPNGLSCSIHYDFPQIVAPIKFPEIHCGFAKDLNRVSLRISRVDLALQQYGKGSDDAKAVAASQQGAASRGQVPARRLPFKKAEALLRAEDRNAELEQTITRMMQESEEMDWDQDRGYEELSESESSSTGSD